MNEDAARIVREISGPLMQERPDNSRRALCDILGVLIGHTFGHLPEGKREEMLEASLAMICDEITVSYREFMTYKKSHEH